MGHSYSLMTTAMIRWNQHGSPMSHIRLGLTESAHYSHSVITMTSVMSSWWDQQGLPTTTVVSYAVRLTMSFHYYCNVVIILLEPTRLSYVGQTYLDGHAYCTLLPNCELISYFSFTGWCFLVFVVWLLLQNADVARICWFFCQYASAYCYWYHLLAARSYATRHNLSLIDNLSVV